MKPILFNTEMVRAILENRKTATRRLVKYSSSNVYEAACANGLWYETFDPMNPPDHLVRWYINSVAKPPCRPGDTLYVRETWRIQAAHRFEADARIEFKAGGPMSTIQFSGHKSQSHSRDSYDSFISKWGVCSKWHPSIHMPREAARIFLRVTGVRVERLQDITDVGARADGIGDPDVVYNSGALQCKFAELWNGTLKPADRALYGWSANPWVWVIEFERISREEAVGNA